MATLLRLALRGAPLNELWAATPAPLLRRLTRVLGVSADGAHEYLCESLGCRCDDLTPAGPPAARAAA